MHDGEKMAAPSYSVPNRNVAPGSRVPNEDMQIIESMPVKSLVTYPQSGIDHDYRQRMTVRGHAWAGDNQISGVFLSIDFGATWLPPQSALPQTDFLGKALNPGSSFQSRDITKFGPGQWTTWDALNQWLFQAGTLEVI